MDKLTVDVVQFLRPNGFAKEGFMEIDSSSEVEEGYRKMLEDGCRLTAEVLMSGEISFTIENAERDADLDVEITQNGPGINRAIEDMLCRYSTRSTESS